MQQTFKFICLLSTLAFINPATAIETKAQTELAIEDASKKIEIYEKTLSNGLKIVVVPMKTNNVIRFGIMYNVGCADDPMGKIGISHFLEHMMFKGTKNISKQKLKYLLEKYNAYTNAGTGYDFTYYYHDLNKTFLDVDLNIEADRMQNLLLNEEEINSEKNVVLEERNMRYDADPYNKYFADAMYKTLYLYSNYSYNGIGYPHQIKAYTKTATQVHYNKFYTPNNAIIIITGDITKEEAFEKVEKVFGPIKKHEDVIKRDRVIDPSDIGIKYSMERESPQITNRDLTIMYTFDRKHIDTLKKNYIVKIMNDILGGTQGSVMFKKLIDENDRAYGISTSVDVRAFDKAFLSVLCSLREKTDEKEIEAEILNIISSFKTKYLNKEIFQKTKDRMLNGIDMMFDSPSGMFDVVLENIVTGYRIDDLKNTYNIIKSITFSDVQNMADIILNPDNKTHRFYSHPKKVKG